MTAGSASVLFWGLLFWARLPGWARFGSAGPVRGLGFVARRAFDGGFGVEALRSLAGCRLAHEGLVDVQQDSALSVVQPGVSQDGVGDIEDRGFTEIGALLEDAGADVEGLGRDAQGLGEGLQDLGARLLQPALDLGEVGVADPGHRGQLPQRELGRVALLSQVVAEIVNGDRRELGHDPIMLAPVSRMQT